MGIFLDASFLVYLNIDVAEAEKIDELFRILLKEDLYTDVLVLDEVIYISKRKYGVPYDETIKLLDDLILPNVEILPIRIDEYLKARENILKYNLKPSDAIHLAVIENNGIQAIVTEDRDFRRVPIKVIWVC